MAFLNETFNAADLPQSNTGSYEPLPDGDYQVTIEGAEIKTTNDGTGQYIKLKMKVNGPTHSGRVLFSNLNIRNKSAKAEEIGRAQLGDIMRAINLPSLSDTDQLIGAPLVVKVKVKPADGQYEAGNEVKAYKSASGSAAPAPSFAASAAAPAPAPTGATPPWARK